MRWSHGVEGTDLTHPLPSPALQDVGSLEDPPPPPRALALVGAVAAGTTVLVAHLHLFHSAL